MMCWLVLTMLAGDEELGRRTGEDEGQYERRSPYLVFVRSWLRGWDEGAASVGLRGDWPLACCLPACLPVLAARPPVPFPPLASVRRRRKNPQGVSQLMQGRLAHFAHPLRDRRVGLATPSSLPQQHADDEGDGSMQRSPASPELKHMLRLISGEKDWMDMRDRGKMRHKSEAR
jgi:hypothetical protein